MGLDSIAPVVTGNPHTSIEDLVRNHPDRENLEKLPDAELLRMAAREVCHGRGHHGADNSGTSSIIGEHQCRRGG
jgi:hypothetical protein